MTTFFQFVDDHRKPTQMMNNVHFVINYMQIITRLLIFTTVFSILLACDHEAKSAEELENLKKELFKKSSDISALPIYADPPTFDFEKFKNNQFSFQIDSNEIEEIDKYRNELESSIVQHIDSGYSWVYLAAYLHYQSAVPRIKELLLKCNRFYGWEGPDYKKIDTYLDDGQYCYQMAYIAAIEHITGKAFSEAVVLTEQENSFLKSEASKCVESNKDALKSCWTRWLLNKLSQKPLGLGTK